MSPSLQRMSDIEYEALGYAWGKSTVDTALLHLAKTKDAASRDETFDQLVADTANVTDAAVTSEVDQIAHAGEEGAAFESWLQSGTKPEGMNCWEYVLYMGVQWGLLTREEVRAIYVDDFETLTTARALEIFSEDLQPVDRDDLGALSIGDAIVLNKPERHVLISLGGAFVADLGTWTRVNITTLDKVFRSQSRNVRLARQNSKLNLSAYINPLLDKMDSGEDLYNKLESFYQDALPVFEEDEVPETVQAFRQSIVNLLDDEYNIVDPHRGQILRCIDEGSNVQVYRIPAATWTGKVRAG